MKKIELALLLGMTAALLTANWSSFVSAFSGLQEDVFRLHILADSDSTEDQYLKLCVRDAILEHSEELFADAENADDAAAAAEEHLDAIVTLAEETLLEHGCRDSVSAEVVEMTFPEKVYEEYTMPAGTYQALRIVIGSGAGQNWWCVLYPALCLPAAEEDAADAFTPEQQSLLEEPQQYQVKLKFVEWWRSLREKEK